MTATVMDAQRWVNEMLRYESRGSGDTENAMKRLGNRYGIPWRVFWALKYRAPKDLLVSVYEQIRTAHTAECERQLRKVEHELQIAHSKGVDIRDLSDQVQALADKLADRMAHSRNGKA